MKLKIISYLPILIIINEDGQIINITSLGNLLRLFIKDNIVLLNNQIFIFSGVKGE